MAKFGLFQDIREVEDHAKKDVLEKIQRLDHLISLCDAALTLENTRGYKEFREAIEGLRKQSVDRLVLTVDMNEKLCLSGKVQCFNDVLSVLRNASSNREALALERKSAEDQMKSLTVPGKEGLNPAGGIWNG